MRDVAPASGAGSEEATDAPHGLVADIRCALVAAYPTLYHMAAPDSWPSIQRHGLLSTSALLDLFETDRAQRAAIERMHRPTSVTIRHPRHGVATIRDQKPMQEGRLRTALTDGVTPEAWFRLLNGYVFFWPTWERLERMRSAYRGQPHTILTVDTAALLQAHGADVRLSAINTGATRPFARPRGTSTFQRLANFPLDERRRRVGRAGAVAEIVVPRAVITIAAMACRVDAVDADGVVTCLYQVSGSAD